jgi:hypothetical protein
MGTRSFPGVKSGRGVTLTPHPLLVPLVMKEWSYTSTPLWAVRPVQSLSACTRVTFTFTFTYFLNGISPQDILYRCFSLFFHQNFNWLNISVVVT